MSKEETRRFFSCMSGEKLLMAQTQYAGGLRVSELSRLRVKDLDLERGQVVVRGGKGGKDRVAPLSSRLVTGLGKHFEEIRRLFEEFLGWVVSGGVVEWWSGVSIPNPDRAVRVRRDARGWLKPTPHEKAGGLLTPARRS